MSALPTVTISDGLIVAATLLGPIIAVQLTRWLDDRKEKRGRKLRIFKTLMSTRAYTVAPAHVEALNLIDLEFSADRPKEKPVIAAWRAYLDLLGAKGMPAEQWALRRVDLLVELLFHMGNALGYDFDKTQVIKNGTYAPVAHGRVEEELETIRAGLVAVFKGERPFPIVGIVPDDVAKQFNDIREGLLAVLKGERPLAITTGGSAADVAPGNPLLRSAG